MDELKTEIKTEINRLESLEAAGDECARGQKNVLVAALWYLIPE